ncbi:MAG: SEC-C domain-containing protein, partial [Clostridia bacterium]|nr:SEC-C domain-containing protein [Clostridia bacterium]
VTIATNMAGRGTDIMLGGNAEYLAKADLVKAGYEEHIISEATGFAHTDNEEILQARKEYTEALHKYTEQLNEEKEAVIQAGGLCIIGTERHESRRIDNQLRGRAGRQGDPGYTKFFLSLEDELMKLFGSERVRAVVDTLGLSEDEPIEHNMLTKAIESAQKRVEGRNFGIRKHVLQFDDVMNQQRGIIYSQRQQVLNGESIRDTILKMIRDSVTATVEQYCSISEYPDDWNLTGLADNVNAVYTTPENPLVVADLDLEELTKAKLTTMITDMAIQKYEAKEEEFGDHIREIERVILLTVVDRKWMDHIDDMDQLKNGIDLRAYGQRDPVIEYKFEGYDMFEAMIQSISEETAKTVLNVNVQKQVERKQVAVPQVTSHGDGTVTKAPARTQGKVGPNDPCPCGSGKKYKKCCRP